MIDCSISRYIFLTKFLYNIILPQYISISLLFNFGILGNPNYKTKAFLNKVLVSSVINSNMIYLYNVDSKIQTLLSYYLPSSKIINTFSDISKYSYIITSDTNFSDTYIGNYVIKSVEKIENHLLLMNISK